MRKWNQRPFETRNLFNPAFCGLVIHRAQQGFEVEDAQGLPFSLSLLVLPLCLQRESREVISKNSRGYFLNAIGANPHLLIGFAERTQSLLPYTFEALGLLMQFRALAVMPTGRLQTITRTVRKSESGSDEMIACQRVARVLGREFALIHDRATIYAALGVRP